jgi:hypothetical protein
MMPVRDERPVLAATV